MNRRNIFGGFAAVALVALHPAPASAVTLRTVLVPIYQIGTASSVNVGHTVLASTNYNRLPRCFPSPDNERFQLTMQ